MIKGVGEMRIELNSGGLTGTASLSTMQSEMIALLGDADVFLSALRSVKGYTYNMNGGVGNLQNALDLIESSIGFSTQRQDNLKQTQKKIETFIAYTRSIDKSVAQEVAANKEEFYKVNQWARPWIESLSGIHFGRNINPLRWFDENWLTDTGGMLSSGIGVGALALGLLHNNENANGAVGGGGWLSDIEESSGVTITGSDSFGKVEDGTDSDSLLSGSIEGNGAFVGFDTSGKLEGEFVGYSTKTKANSAWNLQEKKASISAGAEVEGHLAKGSASGNIGLLGGKAEGSVGNVGAKGEVGFSLLRDGNFSPSLGASASAETSVAKGSAQVNFGSEEYDVHANANGSVLTAKAKAEANVGVITYLDESSGRTTQAYGAGAEVGFEAYLAEGTVSGGVTICGIKFDLGASGKVGGAGAKGGVQVTTKNIAGEADLGLGVGLGVSFNVDFSGFENPLDDIGDSLEDIGDNIGSVIEDISDSDWMPWNWF